MALSEENIGILYKNTIQYLRDISEKVPNNLDILKSYYASKFRISQLQTKIFVEKSKNKVDATCPRCCLKLREATALYAVKPETKKSKFAQKVMKKVITNKRLSRFQAQYLKKNDLEAGNRLVITCSFCKKEVSFKCGKPKVLKPVKTHVDVNANSSKAKSKKKKDKYCGLQIQAVVSAQNCKNNKVKNKHNAVQNNVIRENTKNRVIHNEVSSRKQKINQKKNMMQLNKMLKNNSNSSSTPKNNLVQFLQSLSK